MDHSLKESHWVHSNLSNNFSLMQCLKTFVSAKQLLDPYQFVSKWILLTISTKLKRQGLKNLLLHQEFTWCKNGVIAPFNFTANTPRGAGLERNYVFNCFYYTENDIMTCIISQIKVLLCNLSETPNSEVDPRQGATIYLSPTWGQPMRFENLRR